MALCLRIDSIYVPEYAERNSTVILKCSSDAAEDEIYSVKWYKDKEEFYRRVRNEVNTSLVSGVNIDVSADPPTSDNTVVLRGISDQSSGKYGCEISGYTPTFDSDYKEAQMKTVDLINFSQRNAGHKTARHSFTLSSIYACIAMCLLYFNE